MKAPPKAGLQGTVEQQWQREWTGREKINFQGINK